MSFERLSLLSEGIDVLAKGSDPKIQVHEDDREHHHHDPDGHERDPVLRGDPLDDPLRQLKIGHLDPLGARMFLRARSLKIRFPLDEAEASLSAG